MARSRYDRFETINDNQFETFTLEQTNAIKEPDTFAGINTFEYTVKRGDRLDHLAARYLSEDRYWWIIALINNIVLPFLTPGQRLRIPFNARSVLDRV